MQECGGNNEKIAAIINVTNNTKAQINGLIKIAYPKKRAFKKIDRRPIKRRKKHLAIIMMQVTAAMYEVQLMKIAMMPIPYPEPPFKKGGIIADNNQPEIINFNDKIVTVHPNL